MADEKDKKEKRRIIMDIIFRGYATKEIKKFHKRWKFKTLNSEEHRKIWSISTISDDESVNWVTYKAQILKSAFLSLNDIEATEEGKDEIFEQLPQSVIDALYEEYRKLDDIQLQASNEMGLIKEITESPYSRVKFRVMKEFNILPTDKRYKELNEHQMLWLYENIMKDMQEEEERKKQRMDYLAFYINPELAQEVRNKEKEREGAKDGFGISKPVEKMKAHDEATNDPNIITHYGDTTVDEDFDAKLKLFATDEELTELDDDTHKGNSAETKDSFLSRVVGAQKEIQDANEKVLEKQVEEDAKKAGINPDDLDIIEVK